MKKNVRIRHSCCVNLVLYLIGIILMPVGVVMTIMSGLGAGGGVMMPGILPWPVCWASRFLQGFIFPLCVLYC